MDVISRLVDRYGMYVSQIDDDGYVPIVFTTIPYYFLRELRWTSWKFSKNQMTEKQTITIVKN